MSERPIPEFSAPRRVLLAAPRGYCAGVDRAIDIVDIALQTYGAPVYVRKQIVHNLHVVRRLESRGAIFVDELDEVPEGATVVFSAHGVAPEVHAQARSRQLRVVDATCPLVTKVHQEARKFAGKGYDIVLIGHEGHEEVIGTMGEAPRAIHLVGDERAAAAVKIAEASAVDPAWFEGVDSVGVTSGASAPEWLVDELVEALRQRGADEVREVQVVPEDVHFSLPRGLRQDAAAAGIDASGS